MLISGPNDKFCKQVTNCSKNSGRQDAGSLDLLKELQKFMEKVEANDKKHDARLSSMESGLQSTKSGLKSITSRVTNVESGLRNVKKGKEKSAVLYSHTSFFAKPQAIHQFYVYVWLFQYHSIS